MEDSVNELENIDKLRVNKHCKNLKRMLPGGLRISGIFFTSSCQSFSEEIQKNSDFLIKLLRESLDFNKGNLRDLINDDHSEKLVLMIGPESKKLSCYSIDTEDASDSFRQTEIRIRPVLNRWKAIKSSASLSVKVSLSSDRRKESIQSRLEKAVVPYLRSLINDTQMMVCNENLSDSTSLFEHFADTKVVEKEKKTSLILNSALIDTCSNNLVGENYWSNLDFTFYGSQSVLGMDYCVSSSESGASSDTGFQRRYCSELDKLRSINSDERKNRIDYSPEKTLFLEGIIPGIAYLPIIATVGDAKNELRKDLVRSTLARLELITDELNICSGEIEVPRIYLPQRVLVRLPACRVLPLSDYKFSSETPDDVVSRLIHYSLPLGSLQSEQNAQDIIQFLSGKKRLGRSLRNRNSSPASSTTSIDSGHETADYEIAIDTDCLNFGLESEPEFFPSDPMIKDLDKNIEHAVKYRSSIALFIIATLTVLVFGLFIAYFKM